MDFLACGRPVITHAVGEMTTLFEDGAAGSLVAETAQAMADAIQDLVRDTDRRRRMGEAARRLARTYSRENIAEQLQNAYDSAIGRGSR